MPLPEEARPDPIEEKVIQDAMDAFAVIVEKDAGNSWKPVGPAPQPPAATLVEDKTAPVREDDLSYQDRTPPIPREVAVLPVSRQELGMEDLKNFQKANAVFFIRKRDGEYVSDGNVYEIESWDKR